jgi:hypothetical protein
MWEKREMWEIWTRAQAGTRGGSGQGVWCFYFLLKNVEYVEYANDFEVLIPRNVEYVEWEWNGGCPRQKAGGFDRINRIYRMEDGHPRVGLVLGMGVALPFYGFHVRIPAGRVFFWEGAHGEFRRATVAKV